MQEEELIRLIRSWVQENTLDPELAETSLETDTDLLTTGILDSIGFIELLTYLETELGYQIDLATADPQEFTSIKGLCRFAVND